MNAASNVTAVPVINVAKIATCDSLSGLSQLEYHVGYEAGSKDRIYIRIWKNSGGGKFNTDWFNLGAMEKALAGVPPEGSFKAAILAPIAEGKSVNTSSFIGAALLAEGLIVRSEKVARTYERGDADMWRQSLRVLIEAGTNLVPVPIDKPAGNTPVVVGEGKSKPGKKAKPATVSATTPN